MNKEYKGIYFQNKEFNEPQKKFYEHGAHFEYKALFLILEEITKNVKPRINSSVPKKKNISLNKKRASSCKRKNKIYNNIEIKNKEEKINIQKYGIKVNLSQNNKTKNKNKKKEIKNSLIIYNKCSKNFSCEKKIRRNKLIEFDNNNSIKKISFNNYNIKRKKCHVKYNSTIANNSMEYDNIFNKNLKKDSLLFSYYRNYIKDHELTMRNENKISLNKKLNFYQINKNCNLITKENKNDLILDSSNIKNITNKTNIINSFSIKDEIKKIEFEKFKNKMNTSYIINNNKYDFKGNNNFVNIEHSFHIKTPKYNFIKKINNINKNKVCNNEVKMKCNKKKKLKISRNNDNNSNLNTENSFFNYLNSKDKNSQLTFRNCTNHNLIIKNKLNTTEKTNFNLNISEVKKSPFQNRYAFTKKDMINHIKNKLLGKKLGVNIKERINKMKINESVRNEEKGNIITNNRNEDKKSMINYSNYKNRDNFILSFSTKSNNDSINKSTTRSNKNGDKKSIISTNLTSHINSKGTIIPLYQKKNNNNI